MLDEIAERIGGGLGRGEDRVDGGTVEGFDAAAAGIGEEARGEHPGKLVLAIDQNALESGDVAEALATGKFTG